MNKSKFLKKSLAMLLALMLVVAMIPLSASAAELPAIESIYVNGNKVDLKSEMTVDIGENDTTLTVGTNFDLTEKKVEMYAAIMEQGVPQYKLIDVDGTIGTTFSGDDANALSRWAPDDVMTLEVYPIDGPEADARLAKYTLKLNRTTDNTTTNLAKVEAVQSSGVYAVENDIDDINATQTVKVTAAYKAANPQIKVTGDEEATINDVKTATVNAGPEGTEPTFEVVSESKNNTAEYTVETTYVDALTSFSVNGVEGQITDEDDDDHDDKITVVLPKKAVLDSYGDPIEDPEFTVDFAVYAKNGTISIANGEDISSPATVKFTGLADGTEYKGKVVTTVIGEVEQEYELIVKIAEDTDSTLNRVMIETPETRVETTIYPDGKTLTGEVPSNATISKSTVTVYTSTTVKGVSVAGKVLASATVNDKVTGKELKQWTTNTTVDLTTEKTITVTAQNNTITEYTLDVSKATEVKEPAIESFSIEDPDTGIVYTGTPDSKRVIEIEVPYMTINVADWIVRVTAAEGTTVVNSHNNALSSGQYNVYGATGLSGTAANVDVVNGLSFPMDAVSKGNDTDTKTYTVKVVLAEPGSGKTLKTLKFTSQNGTTDEVIYRALDDDNTFEAKIDQSKKTITLQPALSLTEADFNHYVTEYATAEGAVAFYCTNRSNGEYSVNELAAITSDDNDKTVSNYTKLGTGKDDFKGYVVVVPEKIARDALTTEKISETDVDKSGTAYTVDVVPAKALKEADLKTFKIGDVELEVSGNTISGELPWSYTIAADADKKKASENKIADGVTIYGYYPEFTMGKYAEMSSANKVFNSLGDVNGDGKAEAPSDNNMSLVFVQGANNTVDVYRANEKNVSTNKIEYLTVKAEDRLNDADVTSKNYVFKLTYAEPEIEANIESFKLGGYTGTINGTSINVRVPYKTDLKGMVAEFTTSTGAKVYYDGQQVKSGETVLNYSSPVKLVVHSEKTKDNTLTGESVTVKTYTISVTEAEMFSDVSENKWYYDYVLDAANLGIINGRGDGIFAPEEDVTRGDFAVMLTNMLGVKNMPSVENNPFADVNENKYYSDAIAYCYREGYIGGYPDGTFKPEQSITRQEAAKIMAEAMELTEVSDELFNDDAKIGGWASEFVYQCRAAGIFGGDADTGNFRPTDAVSRAETAKIMVEAYNLK